jgi:hypothetical protein
MKRFRRILRTLAPASSCPEVMHPISAAVHTGSSTALPHLGLGMAGLGRPGYINLNRELDLAQLGGDRSIEAMRVHAESVLDTAWKAGVRSALYTSCFCSTAYFSLQVV